MQRKAYLRSVEEADRELLFEWANDAETRRQSFTTSPISWEEHTAWFARTQADENCRHWILMICDETAYPAGVLRLVRDEDEKAYRISYSIAPAWRGHGYGSLLLTLAKKWAAAMCPDCIKLYGEVKAENTASVRCFEKAGYEKDTKKADEEGAVRFWMDVTREALIYFRADANGQVGYGHLMRCLTIADACEGHGMQPVFVLADAQAQETVLGRGFPCLVLKTDHRDMESELPRLPVLLKEGQPIVIDSYFLTRHYAGTLKKNGYRVVWMDDLGEHAYPVDMLINYNVYAKQIAYPHGHETDLSYLLGPSYAPVRPSFKRESGSAKEEIRTVLVTTGGSDPYGAGVYFTKLLMKLVPDGKILAVCGPYSEGKEELYRLAGQNANVEVIEGCGDLSQVMRRSDLAVAAAGSTLYELCAVGLPSVIYYVADNQKAGAETFARQTGVVNLGDIRSDGFWDKAAERLAAAIEGLRPATERQKLADAMHAIVDGGGAERIAEALAALVFAR